MLTAEKTLTTKEIYFLVIGYLTDTHTNKDLYTEASVLSKKIYPYFSEEKRITDELKQEFKQLEQKVTNHNKTK